MLSPSQLGTGECGRGCRAVEECMCMSVHVYACMLCEMCEYASMCVCM